MSGYDDNKKSDEGNLKIEKLLLYVKKILLTLAVIILATMLSSVLFSMGVRAENIFMLYTFGILIIIIETKEYIFGVVSSLISVAVFNYFFTEPRYTFQVYDSNYFISFAIFLVVSVVVTSLVIKIQRQLEALKQTQMITDALYKISSGYLHVTGIKQVALYGVECLQNIHGRHFVLFVNDRKKQERIPYSNQDVNLQPELLEAEEWCFIQSVPCGKGTKDYSQLGWYMMPVVSKGVTYGVLAVNCETRALKPEDRQVIEAILSVMAVALDREYTAQAEQESKFASEREKLRNNLLRSISHDLRTPLAGITGSASFLLESYTQLDEQNRNTLLSDILNDSVRLSQLVDNLLNMTRIQDGKLELKYEKEVVDDIVGEAGERVRRRLGGRNLEIKIPLDFHEVPMDGQLIIQVLVNLIDNAIKHTKANGRICLSVDRVKLPEKKDAPYTRFAVSDNGTGIPSEVRDHMFDSFVTTDIKGTDSVRGKGVGLGLSIAREIIRVHKGTIGGNNNQGEGATVYFLLPEEREEQNE